MKELKTINCQILECDDKKIRFAGVDEEYELPNTIFVQFADENYNIYLEVFEPDDFSDCTYFIVHCKNKNDKNLNRVYFFYENGEEIFSATDCCYYGNAEICDIFQTTSVIISKDIQKETTKMTLYMLDQNKKFSIVKELNTSTGGKMTEYFDFQLHVAKTSEKAAMGYEYLL